MIRLVVHHICASGAACDFSGHRNHGLPFDATDMPAPEAPGFTSPRRTAESASRRVTAWRTCCLCGPWSPSTSIPGDGLTRSCYLMAGRPSFGLAVDPDSSLQGMIWTPPETGRRRRAQRASYRPAPGTPRVFLSRREHHREHNCSAQAI